MNSIVTVILNLLNQDFPDLFRDKHSRRKQHDLREESSRTCFGTGIAGKFSMTCTNSHPGPVSGSD